MSGISCDAPARCRSGGLVTPPICIGTQRACWGKAAWGTVRSVRTPPETCLALRSAHSVRFCHIQKNGHLCKHTARSARGGRMIGSFHARRRACGSLAASAVPIGWLKTTSPQGGRATSASLSDACRWSFSEMRLVVVPPSSGHSCSSRPCILSVRCRGPRERRERGPNPRGGLRVHVVVHLRPRPRGRRRTS